MAKHQIKCSVEEHTIKCFVREAEIIRIELSEGNSTGNNSGFDLSANLIQENLTSQVNGTKIDFIVSNNFDSIKVFVNGLKETVSILNSNTFRFSLAPDIGDTVQVEYIKQI